MAALVYVLFLFYFVKSRQPSAHEKIGGAEAPPITNGCEPGSLIVSVR
jgi:hypothetical protein